MDETVTVFLLLFGVCVALGLGYSIGHGVGYSKGFDHGYKSGENWGKQNTRSQPPAPRR